MTVYHFSNYKFEKFDLSKFGENCFTRKDRTILDTPRIYFYKDPSKRELFIGSKYCYVCEVDESKVYKEKELFKRYEVLHDAIEAILNEGYEGIEYGNVVVLFRVENVKILEVR